MSAYACVCRLDIVNALIDKKHTNNYQADQAQLMRPTRITELRRSSLVLLRNHLVDSSLLNKILNAEFRNKINQIAS